jgi:hypothetical protein
MITHKGDLMVMKRTKKLRLGRGERIENEIWSWLDKKSIENETFLTKSYEDQETWKKVRDLDILYIDVEKSVKFWLEQYTEDELRLILDKFRDIESWWMWVRNTNDPNFKTLWNDLKSWFDSHIVSEIRNRQLEKLFN